MNQVKKKPTMSLQTIDLDLTNNCVLACDYCFRGAKNPRRLSLETAKAAIDWFIKESGENKKISVALFGGEPLMEFDLIKQLVPYAKKQAAKVGKNINFGATTNCVLINDEMIDFFRKYKMTFHTSIDGGPESQDKHRHFPDGSGTSAIIEPKIKKILKYWPTRTARMSVSNDTVHRWMEDVLYLVDLGYKNLAMIPIPEQNWTEEQFEIALLNDDSNEVGQVHLGVVHLWRLDEPKVEKREQMITQMDFMTIEELQSVKDTMETWSSLCLQHLDRMTSQEELHIDN